MSSAPLLPIHHPLTDQIALPDGRLRLGLSLPGDVAATAVWVRYELDNEEYLDAMQPGADGRWWAEIPRDPSGPTTRYAFKFLAEDRQYWWDAAGLGHRVPSRRRHFQAVDGLSVPDWLWSQVFYQVFPDRFRNGRHALTLDDGAHDHMGEPVVRRTWDEMPDPSQGAREFFGGDLWGVIDALPYLQERLGVSALYLNPIFASRSSHGYDTDDYFRVAPHFGGEEALISLRQATRERDMRLMLDAVVNHTSPHHPWFEAALDNDHEARARYAFQDDGSYACWKGFRNLPKLDYRNPDVMQRMVSGETSVLRYWLQPPFEIDGWRLDAVHMAGEGASASNNANLVRAIRRAVKSSHPQAYVLGEHFFEAAEWLQGDQEDGAMNYYGFAHPVRAWLAGLDISGEPCPLETPEFAAWLAEARGALPFLIQLSQLNLLDSHDTPRFLTLLGGNLNRQRIALGLLMTYIGVPCLYYGDEIGLEGGPDPDCRRPFPWDESHWNQALLTWTQQLIRWRREQPALQRGVLIDLLAQGDLYAFARVLPESAVIVVCNRGGDANLPLALGTLGEHARHWTDLQTGRTMRTERQQLLLALPAESISLFSADSDRFRY